MDDEQEPRWDPSQRHEYLVLTRDELPDAASQFAGYDAPGRLCFYITLPRPFRRDDRLQFSQDDERALHETMAELHAAIRNLSLANEPCEDHPPETHLVIHIEYADAAAEEEQAEGVAVDPNNSKGAGSETNGLNDEEAMPHFGRQDGVANTPLLPSITAFTVSSPMPFPAHEATFYQMARRMPNLKFLNISASSVTLNTAQHIQLRNELADSLNGLPPTLREIRITSTDYYYSTYAKRRLASVPPRSDAAADEPDRVTLAVRELLHMPNLTHVSIAMGIDWELFCTHKAPGLPVKRGSETFPTLMVWLLPYWAPYGGAQPAAISKRHKSNKSKSGQQQQQQPNPGSTSQQKKKQPQPTTSVAEVDEVCFHAAKLADVMPGDFTFLLDIPGFGLEYYCWRDTLRINYRPSELRPIPKTAKEAILCGATRAAWRKMYELQRDRPGNFKVPRPKGAKLSFEINSRVHTEFV